MDEMEKLRALIPLWIEHNEEHASEFIRWAELAGEAAVDIRAAAAAMAKVNESLSGGCRHVGPRQVKIPTRLMPDVPRNGCVARAIYTDTVTRSIALAAARTEAAGYCKETGLQAVMSFARRLGYSRLKEG
jgi:hypothetical protein